MAEPLAHNKKAFFDYEVLEKYEAGIELIGLEVKSIRGHHASLLGAYIGVRGGEVYLFNADIAPYQKNNTPKDYDPKRVRRLLLSKDEIQELAEVETGKGGGKGLTIVPISMYNKEGKIKVEIATVRGKKQFDKRESIKKRDTEREVRREFRDR